MDRNRASWGPQAVLQQQANRSSGLTFALSTLAGQQETCKGQELLHSLSSKCSSLKDSWKRCCWGHIQAERHHELCLAASTLTDFLYLLPAVEVHVHGCTPQVLHTYTAQAKKNDRIRGGAESSSFRWTFQSHCLRPFSSHPPFSSCSDAGTRWAGGRFALAPVRARKENELFPILTCESLQRCRSH